MNFHMIIDIGVLMVCGFAALAFGANEQWAMGAIIAVSGILLAAKIIHGAFQGTLRLCAEKIYLPLILLAALAGAQALFWKRGIADAGLFSIHTVERHSTLLYLLLIISYMVIMFLVQNGFYSRRRVKMLMLGILILGVFEALYGLVQFIGRYGFIWNYEIKTGVANGTFINRNHYALFMNLSMCVGTGYIFYRARKILGPVKLSLRNVIRNPASAKLLWIILIIALMGLALIFSMSRMGVTAMIISAGVMILSAGSVESGKHGLIAGIILLSIVVGLALYTGIEPVLARFEGIEKLLEEDQDRLAIWRDAAPMIKKNIIFGRGLGSFRWTFPEYESVLPDIPSTYAHNDYMQAIAEIGVVGLGLLLWAAWLIGKTAIKNLRSKDPLIGGIGLASIGMLTAVVLQEITDFGLYIPGVAVMAAVMAGLNLRASVIRSEKQ